MPEEPAREGQGSAPWPQSGARPSRRGFLEWLLGTVVVVTGLTFVRPVLRYLSPRRLRGSGSVLMGKDGRPVPYSVLNTESFVLGMGVGGEPTIVVRYSGETRAFSAVCTHLGCLVKWEPGAARFVCPCHNGHFDADGVNISGPPPRPLRKYRVYATGKGEIGLEELPS